MPINFEEELTRRRLGLDELLAKRKEDIISNINRARENISIGREKFFRDYVSPRLEGTSERLGLGLGGARESAFSRERGILGEELERGLSGRKRREESKRLDLIYENLLRRGEEAGLTLDETVEFARQGVIDEIQRRFKAEEEQRERESALRKESIAEEYSKRGLDLERAYSPRTDYGSALRRSLFGLGGSLLTYKLLNRGRSGATERLSNLTGTGETLREQSGFIPRDYFRQRKTLYG